MKIAFLTNASNAIYAELQSLASPYKHKTIDTTLHNISEEPGRVRFALDEFHSSDTEILIIKFSGCESVSQIAGDEFEEMIITFNSNKNSRNYISNPEQTFLELIQLF